jgi:drug/metabolite transporter (DMT)-like permease
MSEAALALALGAAALHAVWNLLLARARDIQATTAFALLASVVVVAPLAAVSWDVDASALPFVTASAALELAYFSLLAAAYARAELSVVYPVARGSAPVLVLLGALTLGRTPSVPEAIGVLLIATGVVAVRGWSGRGTGFGLVIALAIAGYTLVDDRGIERADPIAYLELVMIPVAIVAAARVGRARLRAAAGLTPLAVGLASFAAYALALAALRLAPAAPVAAVRETSVLIAVVLAGMLLHERVGPARIAGSVIVVLGVVVLGAG